MDYGDCTTSVRIGGPRLSRTLCVERVKMKRRPQGLVAKDHALWIVLVARTLRVGRTVRAVFDWTKPYG